MNYEEDSIEEAIRDNIETQGALRHMDEVLVELNHGIRYENLSLTEIL